MGKTKQAAEIAQPKMKSKDYLEKLLPVGETRMRASPARQPQIAFELKIFET